MRFQVSFAAIRLMAVLAGPGLLGSAWVGAAVAEQRSVVGSVRLEEGLDLSSVQASVRGSVRAPVFVWETTAPDGEVVGVGRYDRIPVPGLPDPVALSVAASDTGLVLRGAVIGGGGAVFATDPVQLAAGSAAVELGGTLVLRRQVSLVSGRLMRCGDRLAEIALDGPAPRLRIGRSDFALAPVPAASGARFEVPGDPGTWVASRSDVATISLRGDVWPECIPAIPSALLPLRARGNEPFWTLDIDDARMVWTSLDGSREEVATGAPAPIAGGLRLGGPDGPVVEILDQVARDSMTGMPYPFAVRLHFGAQVLEGRAGDPAVLLAGAWDVTATAAGPLPPGAAAELRFAGDRVAAYAGCNRMAGGWSLSGEGLRIGPMAATRMACEPAKMSLDAAVSEAVAAADRFDLTPGGDLVLIAADRPVLTARR